MCMQKVFWAAVFWAALVLMVGGLGVVPSAAQDVRVNVVDQEGRPVAAAQVWLVTSQVSSSEGMLDLLDQAETDDSGMATISVPERWSRMVGMIRQEIGLIAAKDEALGMLAVYRMSRVPPELTLDLNPATTTTVTVRDAGGKPVLGVRVSANMLLADQLVTDMDRQAAEQFASQFNNAAIEHPHGFLANKAAIPLPDELSRKYTDITNSQGQAVIRGLLPSMVGAIVLSQDRSGKQNHIFNTYSPQPHNDWLDHVVLQEPIGVTGKLVADDPDVVRSRDIVIRTALVEQNLPVFITSSRTARTDERGRFNMKAVVPGRWTPYIAEKAGADYQPVFTYGQSLEPGKQNEITINLKPSVQVSGLVQAGDGNPLANLPLHVLDARFAQRWETTDDRGRFSFAASPGTTITLIPLVPPGYAPIKSTELTQFQFPIPADTSTYDMQPIVLGKQAVIRGVVVDADGQPVPAATVTARAYLSDANKSFSTHHEETTTTDADGRFQLTSIDSRARRVQLEADKGEATTNGRLLLPAPPPPEITLRISTGNKTSVLGRVVGVDGQPIEGAKVSLQMLRSEDENLPGNVFRADGQAPSDAAQEMTFTEPIRTDAQGRFQTPPLKRDRNYRAVVGRGKLQATSAWLEVGTTSPARFSEITVKRMASVRGTVQDVAGNPLQKARVVVIDSHELWETTTGADGSFTFGQLPDAGCFLFIQQDGFRLHGELLVASQQAGTRKLVRIDQPATAPLRSSAGSLPREQRLVLAKRVFQPYLDHVLRQGQDGEKMQALEILARIDPAQALTALEPNPFTDKELASTIRWRIAQTFARADLEAAIEITEGFSGAYMRAIAYRSLAMETPQAGPAVRRDLLARALVDAKSVNNPAQRVVLLGLVGEALLDLGDRAAAEKVLRTGQTDATKLPDSSWAGFARGAFAEELAQIDLAAALPMAQGLADPDERNRHLGNMAHELAGIDPAAAHRVLDLIEVPADSRYVVFQRDQYVVRVCHRMAGVDLPRAIKIAESCRELNQQAYALGLIADSVAESDPDRAEQLVRRAFKLLDRGERDAQQVRVHASQVAGALLPIAEKVDPSLGTEMFWAAIMLRTKAVDDSQYVAWQRQQSAWLAIWLSRFNRPVAEVIVQHWIDYPATAQVIDDYLMALALVHPRKAVELAESKDKPNLPDRSRLTVARALSLETKGRWRAVHDECGLWAIGVEDY